MKPRFASLVRGVAIFLLLFGQHTVAEETVYRISTQTGQSCVPDANCTQILSTIANMQPIPGIRTYPPPCTVGTNKFNPDE